MEFINYLQQQSQEKNRQYLRMDQLLKYSQQFREYLMAVNQDLQE